MPLTHDSGSLRITDYAEANEIAVSRAFRQAKDDEIELIPIKRSTIPVLHGEEHRRRRMAENGLFRGITLRRLELDVLDRSVAHQIRCAKGAVDPSSPRQPGGADLIQLARLSLLPVTAALIGIDGVSVEDDASLSGLSDYASAFATGGALEYKTGPIGQEREASLSAARRFHHDLFAGPWTRRKAMVAEYESGRLDRDELPSDLMTALLLHIPDLPEDVACREAIGFIVASTDSSVMAVATCMHHLESWFADRVALRSDLVKDPRFIEAAVFEAIRLHPPPALIRAATEETVLSSGRRINAGDRVIVDVKAANRDPGVFGDDADDFNPYRPLPAKVKGYGLGFGAGSHACIGRPMATAHKPATEGTTLDDSVGTTVRMLMRLYEASVRLHPQRAPRFREGWIQERYESFPIVFGT
jgi:cytochrome P450